MVSGTQVYIQVFTWFTHMVSLFKHGMRLPNKRKKKDEGNQFFGVRVSEKNKRQPSQISHIFAKIARFFFL